MDYMKTAQVFDVQNMPKQFHDFVFAHYRDRGNSISNDVWVEWYWKEKSIEHPDWNQSNEYYEFQDWMVEQGAIRDNFTLIKYWW
jgi:hypothetical protein